MEKLSTLLPQEKTSSDVAHKKNNNIILFIILLSLLIAGFLFFINIKPDYLDASYQNKYSFLLYFYLFYIVCFAIFNFKNCELFSPLLFAYIFFYFIFVFRPLYDIVNSGGIFSSSGKDLSEGCYKATIIFGLGLLSMSIGFSAFKSNGKITKFFKTKTISKSNNYLKTSLLIWVTSFMMCLLYFILSGYSLSYIFTLGIRGTASVNSNNSLLFLSTFKSCLVASWIYICLYSKSTPLKIITFVLGLLPFLLMGRRAAAIIYILSPIIYYVLSKNKKINPLIVFLLAFLLLVFIVVIGDARYRLVKGDGLNISFNDILKPFDYELTTYRCFYGLVDSVPDQHGFTYGYNMFVYTILMIIPRAIWPNKPDSPINEIMIVSVDKTAVDGGAVFPSIGEFYFEFGVLGVILFMFILGFMTKKLYGLKKEFIGSNNHGLVLFSVEFMVLIQVLSRGNTPSNFYYVLFTALPAFIILFIDKKNSNHKHG